MFLVGKIKLIKRKPETVNLELRRENNTERLSANESNAVIYLPKKASNLLNALF